MHDISNRLKTWRIISKIERRDIIFSLSDLVSLIGSSLRVPLLELKGVSFSILGWWDLAVELLRVVDILISAYY